MEKATGLPADRPRYNERPDVFNGLAYGSNNGGIMAEESMVVWGRSPWVCNAVDADGVECGRRASLKMGVDTYRCHACDPPTCEVCEDRDSVGWLYYPKYHDKPNLQKKTHICKECLPPRTKPYVFNGACAFIE